MFSVPRYAPIVSPQTLGLKQKSCRRSLVTSPKLALLHEN